MPQENLIDSPPNEFNLSGDDENENQLINLIENSSENLIKSLSAKYRNDTYLIDAFSNTILRILEIKCHDPKVTCVIVLSSLVPFVSLFASF